MKVKKIANFEQGFFLSWINFRLEFHCILHNEIGIIKETYIFCMLKMQKPPQLMSSSKAQKLNFNFYCFVHKISNLLPPQILL